MSRMKLILAILPALCAVVTSTGYLPSIGCRHPGHPDDGYAKPSSGFIRLGGKVFYSCKSGYTLVGSSWSKCTLLGIYPKKPKCVRKQCKVPDGPAKGGVEPDAGSYVDVGEKISFYCTHGYYIVGNVPPYICQSDGTFEPSSIPTCRKRQCTVPGGPANGGVNPAAGSDVDVGERIEFYCERGYEIVGNKPPYICQSDGTFDPSSIPTCKRIIKCKVPRGPANGGVDPDTGDLVDVGDNIRFSCNPGFRLSGTEKAVCTPKGRFSPSSIPKCIRQCTVPNGPDDGGVDPDAGDKVDVGSVIDFFCNRGLELFGPERAICQKDGTFDPDQIPTCRKRTCKVPSGPDNGSVDPDAGELVDVGEKIVFNCNSGYKLVGPGSARCQKDGGFDPSSIPTCRRQCRVPRGPRNGGVDPSAGSLVDLGDTIEFFCDDEFTLVGESTATCTRTGKFDPSSIPICKPRQCRVPKGPRNGGVNKPPGSSVNVGVTIKFFCDRGFDLIGDSTATCTRRGTFDPSSIPTCRVQCQVPDGPIFGSVSPDTGSYVDVGKVIEFDCNSGFTLVGNQFAKCTSSGTFSPPSIPVCKKEDVRCKSPGPPRYGGVDPRHEYFDAGDMITFCCNYRYRLVGTQKSTCRSDGTWYPQIRVSCSKRGYAFGGYMCDIY